jgi:hypothetical protein
LKLVLSCKYKILICKIAHISNTADSIGIKTTDFESSLRAIFCTKKHSNWCILGGRKKIQQNENITKTKHLIATKITRSRALTDTNIFPKEKFKSVHLQL